MTGSKNSKPLYKDCAVAPPEKVRLKIDRGDNLPEEITIKIHTLSGIRIRTLTIDDKPSPTSPFLRWDLQNESGLRVASGMYIALISSPKFGDKVLKFAIIMPQKQIPKF